MKTILGIIILAAIGVGGYFLLKDNKVNTADNNQTNSSNTTMAPTPTPSAAPTISDHPIVLVETSMGNFKVTLDHTAAPKTVENFVKLANDKYYEGLKFHRVIQSFVIQGGDPNSKTGDPSTWGFGGPGYTVPAEIKLTAKVGAIGMASTTAKGPSSGSQFFIVTTESQTNHMALDGNYTLFGYVTSGMDVVTKIAAVPTDPTNDMPLTVITINKITIE